MNIEFIDSKGSDKKLEAGMFFWHTEDERLYQIIISDWTPRSGAIYLLYCISDGSRWYKAVADINKVFGCSRDEFQRVKVKKIVLSYMETK